MKTRTTLQAAFLAAALAACGGTTGGGSASGYAAAMPDVAGLTLEATDRSQSTTSALEAAEPVGGARSQLAAAPAADCKPWQYLCNIQKGVKRLNDYLKQVVGQIEALAATAPSTTTGDEAVHGPVAYPAAPATAVVDFQLRVTKDGDADHFKFKLEARAHSADPAAAFAVVAAGKIKKGDQPHRGHGKIALDADALHALDPVDFKAVGKLYGAFAHTGRDQKVLVYRLANFSPDVTTVDPIPSATFYGHKTPSGTFRVRLAAHDDYVPTTDALEWLVSRAKYQRGTGGRAVVAITGGDVSGISTAAFGGGVPVFNVDFVLGVSCFDAADVEAYHDLFVCSKTRQGSPPGRYCFQVPADHLPAGWTPENGFSRGDVSACLGKPDLFDPGDVHAAATPGTDPDDASDDLADAPEQPDAPPSSVDEVK